MNKLPKNIIKKYGITKKAWSIFRGQKKTKAGSASSAQPNKRKGAKKQMARKKQKSHKSPAMFSLFGTNFYKSDLFEVGGAAGAGAMGGVVSQLSGGKLTGNAAQAAAGLAIGSLGGKYGKSLGKGILKKTAGDLVEDNVIPQIMGALNMGGTSSSNSGTQNNEVLI